MTAPVITSVSASVQGQGSTPTLRVVVSLDQPVTLHRSSGLPAISVFDPAGKDPRLGELVIAKDGRSATMEVPVQAGSKLLLQVHAAAFANGSGEMGTFLPRDYALTVPTPTEGSTDIPLAPSSSDYTAHYDPGPLSKNHVASPVTPASAIGQRFANLEWATDAHNWHLDDATTKKFIDHFKRVGYTGVSFDCYVGVYDDGATVTSVANSGHYTRMFAMMDYARSIGLNVGLKNFFCVGNSSTPISPSTAGASFDATRFMSSLKEFFNDLAPVLQKHGVSLFTMATELQHLVTSAYHAQWKAITDTIRASYSGTLTYDATLNGVLGTPDHSNDWFRKVGIWDLMDIVGVDFAPIISETPIDNAVDLVAQLYSGSRLGNNFATELIELARRTGKPLMVDGIHFWNTARALNSLDPAANEVWGGAFRLDPYLQALGYQSLLDFVNNHLGPYVAAYGISYYTPWAFQTFVGNDGTWFDPAAAAATNQRKVSQSLSGPTLDFTGTLAESVISRYLNNPSGYHTIDTLRGGAGNDILYTHSGRNFIYTNGGSDEVHGGTGDDTVYMGPRDKTLVMSVKSWFTSNFPDPIDIRILVNGTLIGTVAIRSDPQMLAVSPNGYWGEDQTVQFDVSHIKSFKEVQVVASGGLSQIDGMSIAALYLPASPDNTARDGSGARKINWVTGNAVASFDTTTLDRVVSATRAESSTIDGGGGINTVAYPGLLKDFSVQETASGTLLVGRGASPTTRDTLTQIQRLEFDDFSVNLAVQPLAQSMPQGTVKRIAELYVAFFNRTPDADGLHYWLTQAKNGMGIDTITQAFYNAGVQYASLTGFSPAMTNADFVNVVYRNVLGRADGADAGGLAYWTSELASGRATRGTLVSSILDSAHTFKGDPTWGWVANLLDNKYAVARQVAVDWGLNYLTADASVSNGMAIAKAVTPTDTSAAIALVGVPAAAVTWG